MKNGHLKIESGIPLPDRTRGVSKGYTAAIRSLKKGQSVLLPTRIQSANSLLVQMTGKDWPEKFACRSVDGGTRVWRTK